MIYSTCDVTSCHYNSARAEETLNYTRIRNWFWGFERNLDSDARSSNRPIVKLEASYRTNIHTNSNKKSDEKHVQTHVHDRGRRCMQQLLQPNGV